MSVVGGMNQSLLNCIKINLNQFQFADSKSILIYCHLDESKKVALKPKADTESVFKTGVA